MVVFGDLRNTRANLVVRHHLGGRDFHETSVHSEPGTMPRGEVEVGRDRCSHPPLQLVRGQQRRGLKLNLLRLNLRCLHAGTAPQVQSSCQRTRDGEPEKKAV